VLFSRSQDFIPGITFKDVLRFEERNKNVFFVRDDMSKGLKIMSLGVINHRDSGHV
jgi:hypothetical protein